MTLTCSARKETFEGDTIDGTNVGEGSKASPEGAGEGHNGAAVIGPPREGCRDDNWEGRTVSEPALTMEGRTTG